MAGGADKVTIRLATENDAGTLHAMIVELAAATRPGRTIRNSPEDFQRHASAFEALLAEREGTAVGFCLFFYSFSSWGGETGVYVQDLFVAETARGIGLGRRLLAQTARHARQRGAGYLRLSVASSNLAARDFYRRLGMTHATDECIYQAAGPAFERLADTTQAEP